ncbi:MAG: hypothetical protein MJZ23_00250 [Paludibacteraceae bacterium]|nr:hypothetical protein [Paludibacteraceae bacterium]
MKLYKRIALLCWGYFFFTATASAQHTICTQTDSFALRMPKFSQIDLACGTAPDTTDANVVFCTAAAFTGLIKPGFDHINIGGNHIAGGTYYKGFKCGNNSGGFIYYTDGSWKFCNNDEYATALQADNIACAYGQCLVVYKGQTQEKYPKGPEHIAYYRVLCEKDDTLFFFESTIAMPLWRFLLELEQMHVSNALYMEMGKDWDYTWWRNANGSTTVQHPLVNGSNWLIFKK